MSERRNIALRRPNVEMLFSMKNGEFQQFSQSSSSPSLRSTILQSFMVFLSGLGGLDVAILGKVRFVGKREKS